MTKEHKHWYKSWFDTPFYHLLYKDRDHKEANRFMCNLTAYLNLPEYSEILDLACGKGRHSIELNKLGFKVTGIDLSEKSITYAKQFENDNLQFDIHDMTLPYDKTFDAVFNLFTSFGYFDNEEDNQKTIDTFKHNLKPNGIGVIDFLNSNFVINNLVPNEVKTIDDTSFFIKRFVQDKYIIKDITFDYDNNTYNFQERVKAFTLDDFKTMFNKANLTLIDVFGDYSLKPFKVNESPRLIMMFM